MDSERRRCCQKRRKRRRMEETLFSSMEGLAAITSLAEVPHKEEEIIST